LNSVDLFGISVASIGDLNEDGTQDVIVGAEGTNYFTGAVYILLLYVNASQVSTIQETTTQEISCLSNQYGVNCQYICPICVFGNCDSGSYGSGQCICTSNQFFGTLCENQNLCYGRESFCANGSLTSNTAITITNNTRFQVEC